MATYNLLEHREVKTILENEEQEKGHLEKFRVLVPENAVHTAYAEMPSKHYDVYRVDLGQGPLFLVPNEMDDYARYQPLPASVFSEEPVFLGNETPLANAKLAEEQKLEDHRSSVKMRNEKSHAAFFEQASTVNQFVPGFFDIPETLEEYIDSIGSDYSNTFNLQGDVASRAIDAIEKYSDLTGEKGLAMELESNSPAFAKLYKLLDLVETKSFEKEYGFSIETEVIDGSMLSVKALNNKGGVFEQTLISIEDDFAYFDESPERLHRLDMTSMENSYKRYGKHVDYESSLLAVVMDQYEETYFEFSKKASLPEYDDEGVEVLDLSSLQAPRIYREFKNEYKDVAEKLSLVAKVSLDKTVDHSIQSPGMAVT